MNPPTRLRHSALVLGILFLIGAGVVFYILYTYTINLFKERLNEQLMESSSQAMDKVDRIFYERYLDQKAFASDPVISSRNATPEQITERLKTLQNLYPFYASIAFFDRNRIKIAGTSPVEMGKEHPLTVYMKDISEGKDFVMGVSESKAVKDVAFYFASVVKDKDGSVIGVVSARMTLETLHDVARETVGIRGSRKDVKMDLVDKDGLLLYSNYNKEGILKERFPDWEYVKSRSAVAERMKTDKGTFYRRGGIEDEIHVFAHEPGYRDFAGNGWTLILHVPAKEALETTLEWRIVLLYVGGVILILLAFFYIVMLEEKKK